MYTVIFYKLIFYVLMVTVLYWRSIVLIASYSPIESRQNLLAEKIGFLYLPTCLLSELSPVVQVGHLQYK